MPRTAEIPAEPNLVRPRRLTRKHCDRPHGVGTQTPAVRLLSDEGRHGRGPVSGRRARHGSVPAARDLRR